MPDKVSTFRSAEHAQRFLARYDQIVAEDWPVEHEELDVPTGFGRTRVRRSGSGSGVPLVMLHPTSGSSAGWYPVIEGFCADRAVFTPDTMGAVGRSEQTAPLRAPADLARWLDDVLDALELAQVHLLGYSVGGWIAGLHAAATSRPQRLLTLTLIEPAGLERITTRFLLSMVGGAVRVLTARDKHRAVRRLNSGMNGDGYELTDGQIELLLASMTGFQQRLPRPSRLADEQLRSITTPSLILLGEQSRLYDTSNVAARATALMPDVTVELVPSAGHGLLFQQPQHTSARTQQFLLAHDV